MPANWRIGFGHDSSLHDDVTVRTKSRRDAEPPRGHLPPISRFVGFPWHHLSSRAGGPRTPVGQGHQKAGNGFFCWLESGQPGRFSRLRRPRSTPAELSVDTVPKRFPCPGISLMPPAVHQGSTAAQPTQPWPLAGRLVASLLIVLYLAAVILPPLAGPPPASELAIEALQPFRPLIGALGLSHGYRFFAPNPGPGHSIRWQITDAN